MHKYDVIIIGGGPAGCSAAARLAAAGIRVMLLEKSRMLRHKLCGEFITPECFPTLNRLGVMNQVMEAGARKIARLRLVGTNGNQVEAPVSEISSKSHALSLSRARFDHVLFGNARRAGATCLEGHVVKRCSHDGSMATIEAMSLAAGKMTRFQAPLVIDASGRNTRVTTGRRGVARGSRLFGFKAHLEEVEGIAGQVELYFFPGGYGGLSSIEDGLTNLCFITDETRLKKAGGDVGSVMRQTMLANGRARDRLARAKAEGTWMSGGPLVFGRKRRFEPGVIAIGDAAGMIDPFTGTGIQIALRSGELAGEAIIESLGSASMGDGFHDRTQLEAGDADHHIEGFGLADSVLRRYSARYELEFGKRMKIAGLLRAPAFSLRLAGLFGRVLSASPRLARAVLQGSRASQQGERLDKCSH
ncbi:MAG TPA: FAD-dependent oxidoreductase [Blastocatellia bacterium]|nr:FAD-dependent oxidoreductase [Blastocatellia bacterium]